MTAITVNGQPREVPDGETLLRLLERMGLDRGRVAVEHNRRIVPRDLWPGTRLEDGDVLEIVTLVGGGQGRNP